MIRTGILIAALAASAAAPAMAADQCNGPLAAYRVSKAEGEAFDVSAQFHQPTARVDLFYFPIAERPEGQAESVVDLKGYDAAGSEVPINYVGEGGWEAANGAQLSSISYRIEADHDEVNWGGLGAPGKDEVAAHFDDTYFFAGHAFFLLDYNWPACPLDIEFDLPDGWVVTSPWPLEGTKATASAPYNLGQNVFAMGRDLATSKNLGDRELTWLIADDVASARKDIETVLNTLPPIYSEFWGGADWNKYTVFIFGDDMSDGGAFQDSFAMRLATPLNDAEEITWSHTIGHEMMHLWNGAGKLRGANPDQTNWLTEGFTDYLTIKLMRKAGFLSDEMLEQRIANVLRRFEFAKMMSPGMKLEEATKRRGQNWFLIYGGGALTALVLDAEMSAENPTAFRNMMRDLYAAGAEPYDLGPLMERMNASSGGKAGEVIAWIDSQPSAAEIRTRLAKTGIEVSYFGIDEFYVRFPECRKKSCAPAFLNGPR